jgi:hypothetical protein
VSLWSVETPVPPEALDEIRKAAHVARAVGVALG